MRPTIGLRTPRRAVPAQRSLLLHRSRPLRPARYLIYQEVSDVGPERFESLAVELTARHEPVDVGRILCRVAEVPEYVEVVVHRGVDGVSQVWECVGTNPSFASRAGISP